MDAATEFDLGPLTWVKGEIDLALGRAEAAFDQYLSGADPTQLKFCRTHVHQVHGALSIVGLDGVTQVTEALEALLLASEARAGKALASVVPEALDGLRCYLDDLMTGEPNQPLRLLSIYQALMKARGLPPSPASDLFYPDISRRPQRRTAAVSLEPEAFSRMLKAERMRFQKGLLGWLKKPGEAEAGRQLMCAALASIEAHQLAPAARAFWWVTTAFAEALADPAIGADPAARQLCTHIDAQIRRLLNGSNNVAERVMREALYYVARAPAETSPLIAEVQSTFALPALLPAAPLASGPHPQEAAVRRLREMLLAMEELWNKFCTGHAPSLAPFAEYVRSSVHLTEEIGQTDLKRLGQGLGAVAAWLTEAPSRFSEMVAMDVATAILLMQNAQEGFKHLGTDFAQQVDLMVERLYTCIAGRALGAERKMPSLDEMTRRAQEKLLIGQVGREIQNNLAQVEQALDAFFRDPAKSHPLDLLDAPLKQVSGALVMLGHFGAVNSLKACGASIKRFAEADYQPASEDFEAVANQLSLLGFFVDALQNGEVDFDAFARRMQGEPHPDEAGAADVEALPAPSVETQLAQQARDTQVLVEALKETPDDSNLQDELKLNLQSIQKDADLVANRGLGETAKAALEALQTGSMEAAAVDAALAGLSPQLAETEPPSAETLQLAEASHEEIDAELLAIFLEEAQEVLLTLGEQVALLAADPLNGEALITIRRSTHTLKGSGRMVGLLELGDTAWALEQTINLWLRQEQAVTPELIRLLDDEHALFSAWVQYLASGEGAAPDPAALIAEAIRLRGVDTLDAPAAQAAVSPSPREPSVPEEAPSEAEAEDVHLQAAAEALADLLAPAEDAPEGASASEVSRSTPESASISPVAPASPTLYDIFCDEARSHLRTLVDSQAALEVNPGAPTTFEMTRAAHTLGGIAATVGLMPLHHLAIALEHALLRRDGAEQPGSIEALDTLRESIQTLENMFAALAEQQAPSEQAALIATLDAIFLTPVAAPETALSANELLAESPLDLPAESIAPPLSLLTDELDEELLPLFLEEASDQLRDLTQQLRAWRLDSTGADAPRAIARLLHTFKGNARMAGAMNLGEVTHLLETRVQEALRAGQASADFIDEIEAGCDTLAHAVERLRLGDSAGQTTSAALPVVETAPALTAPEVELDGEAGGQRATLRVRADLIDRLVNEAGELSISRARIEGEMRSLKGSLLDLTENVIRLRRQLREIEIQAEGQIQAHVAHSPAGEVEFDPLELDRFTRFQELTRFMAESVNDVATVQQNLLKNLDDANAAILAQSRLNRGLQQALMSVRMVPFASQAERLYRIVRQTAKDVGKRANLDILGGQVDIDRSVLDKMLAPIEHMLRNAVTHGIESRAQRIAAGKPEVGEISLALGQEGNEIILSMVDDGHGLDVQAIRARAEAMGLVQPGQVLDTASLYDFIFQPGFSTAAELTQVAGRGVGMDVVKTEVAALGGRIETLSEPGQGTTFRLYLPLTLAVTQTLLVRVGSQRYAVPSNMIEQVLELKERPLAVIREKGEAEWQGSRYPFHFLAHLLGDSDAVPEAHRQNWVLLLRSGTQRVAVQVDELKGNQEVVVKNIGAQLARVVGIAGATVLGDGQVVLILNPVALASRAPVPGVPSAALPLEMPVLTPPTVMVVDDSLTVRKITSRLLAREGYQVLLAKDGVDALEQLIEVMPDVVLSDIEMPRMDGFDLVRNIRADERLHTLPVIMITSRTAEKHRQYAFEIGANHYLGKPYDEDELLALVAGYVRPADLAD